MTSKQIIYCAWLAVNDAYQNSRILIDNEKSEVRDHEVEMQIFIALNEAMKLLEELHKDAK